MVKYELEGGLNFYEELEKSCEENNGHFAYITRHPLERIHSALIHRLDRDYYNKENHLINNSDIHNHIVDIFSSKKVNNDIKIQLIFQFI